MYRTLPRWRISLKQIVPLTNSVCQLYHFSFYLFFLIFYFPFFLFFYFPFLLVFYPFLSFFLLYIHDEEESKMFMFIFLRYRFLGDIKRNTFPAEYTKYDFHGTDPCHPNVRKCWQILFYIYLIKLIFSLIFNYIFAY